MNGTTNSPAARILPPSFLAGWLSFVALHGFLIFGIPHDAHFSPEVGLSGTFIIFGIIGSLFYTVDFILLTLPAYLLVSSTPPRQHWRMAGYGAGLYAISVPFWSIASGGFHFLEIISCLPIAALPGGVSFYVVSKLRSAAPTSVEAVTVATGPEESPATTSIFLEELPKRSEDALEI